MTTRSLFATQDLEDVATTVELRRLSRRASVDLLRNVVKVSFPFHSSHPARWHAPFFCILPPQPPLYKIFQDRDFGHKEFNYVFDFVGGHPMALRVVGSSLNSDPNSTWDRIRSNAPLSERPAFLAELADGPSLWQCFETSLERLSKEHVAVFAALSLMRCNFDVSAITALLASSESFVRSALLKLHSEAIIDLDTETGTFFMHDLMMMYSGWLHSNMTSKDKDFSVQYRPTVCLARLRGHVLQLLKSETQKVISSGSLCDFTSKPRREMFEHIIDTTRDTQILQELLVCLRHFLTQPPRSRHVTRIFRSRVDSC
jgi:hypothetical protein